METVKLELHPANLNATILAPTPDSRLSPPPTAFPAASPAFPTASPAFSNTSSNLTPSSSFPTSSTSFLIPSSSFPSSSSSFPTSYSFFPTASSSCQPSLVSGPLPRPSRLSTEQQRLLQPTTPTVELATHQEEEPVSPAPLSSSSEEEANNPPPLSVDREPRSDITSPQREQPERSPLLPKKQVGRNSIHRTAYV